jgi:hypothetical protein
MKFKLIFVTTLALIPAVSLVGYSWNTDVKVESSQEKTITFTCPQSIKVGPVNVKGGWESAGPQTIQLGGSIAIINDSVSQEQDVYCPYGKALPSFNIVQQVPAGYICKVEPSQNIGFPSDSVTCTMKIRARPRAR